jgi:hypothetical protein
MGRLLLVGWDAADWKLIEPLLARGEMPHLAQVIARGVRGNLATIYPPLSPMVWTSIATGKRAYKQSRPEDQSLLEHSQSERQAQPGGGLVAFSSGRADPRRYGLQPFPFEPQ